MADWESLGGEFTSAPAVCSWGPGRLDVFGRGTDNALWHKWFTDGEWRGWTSLGGTLTAPPAAVSWGVGRIDVFVRGGDLALWHKWFTGGRWSDWESLGGGLNFGPAVSSWGPRRLDVFARGTDNTIFQRTFDKAGATGRRSRSRIRRSPCRASRRSPRALARSTSSAGACKIRPAAPAAPSPAQGLLARPRLAELQCDRQPE